jgi:hypothetical protein
MSEFKNLVFAKFPVLRVNIILEPTSFAFDFKLTGLAIVCCVKNFRRQT